MNVTKMQSSLKGVSRNKLIRHFVTAWWQQKRFLCVLPFISTCFHSNGDHYTIYWVEKWFWRRANNQELCLCWGIKVMTEARNRIRSVVWRTLKRIIDFMWQRTEICKTWNSLFFYKKLNSLTVSVSFEWQRPLWT